MSVPNQKKIIIQRDSEHVKKNFLKVSKANLDLAMYNLKPTSFLLWIYFTNNANGYHLDLYSVDFLNKTGLSRSTYDRAFAELVEKGYLIRSNKQKNLYLFKEKSESKKIIYTDEVVSLDIEDFMSIKEQFFNQNEEDCIQNETQKEA